MKILKTFILPLIFLLVSISIICSGLYSIGVIHKIKIHPIADVFNVSFNHIKTNRELIDSLKLTDNIEDNAKCVLPDNMNAVWLDVDKDIDVSPDKDVEAIKYGVYSDINFYRNFLLDTFFIKPDTENKFVGLKESNGNKFDILSYILYYIEEISCKTVLVADDAIIFNGKSTPSFDSIKYYLDNYDFDAVVMSAEILHCNASYYTTAKFISENINQYYPDIFFGVEIKSDINSKYADAYVIRVFEERLADFGLVDCGGAIGSQDLPFALVAHWWDSFAEYYGSPLYCKHRLDLVGSVFGGWADKTEINNQLRIMYDCPNFDGSCFYSGSVLKNKKMLAMDLSILLNHVAKEEDVTFSVTDMKVQPSENKVRFTGFTQPDWKVFCSDESIKTHEGKFEESFDLSPGDNNFYFSSNGKSYLYNIYNNRPLILAHFPHNGYTADADTTLSITAVCRENSLVFAVIYGEYYPMTKSEIEVNYEVPKGYCVYSYALDLSAFKILNLGELDIVCGKGGIQTVVNCGSVAISNNKLPEAQNQERKINLVDSSKFISSHSASSVSPFINHGLGTALLCKVTRDYAEQLGEPGDYDTYHPDQSAILSGTLDYVDAVTVSEEGYLRYELKSGVSIYGADSQIICNAFTMPLNNIAVKAFDDSTENETKIVFGLDWLSPITVSPQPLDYETGYLDFSYNISDFDAAYIDISFHYAGSLNETSLIKFSENSVFSDFNLYQGEKDALILRLNLKKPGIFYGYKITKNPAGDVELSFKKHISASIEGKIVMLDPGHGGLSMIGTALKDNSVGESIVTLSLAHKIRAYLKNMGARVIMTRTMDTSLLLSERRQLCRSLNPDVFVSIHCDGSNNINEAGTHTFYYTPFSQPLAENIHKMLVNTYRNKIYKETDINFPQIDKKIKYYPFYVTRVGNCASVLVETGFMTNFIEGMILVNPDKQELLAKAVADGISNYFVSTFK